MRQFTSLSVVTTFVLAVVFVPNVVAESDKLDVEAAEKLVVLKKRLPSILEDWNKSSNPFGRTDQNASVRFIRRTSPTTAKLTFVLEHKKDPDAYPRQIVSIYLHYFDQAWTTTSKDVDWETSNPEHANRQLHRLMLAIDELGQK
jgi:hypothetical protein